MSRSESSPTAPSGRLLRIAGMGFGLAVGVGNTIAAGIVRTPGEVAANVGSPGLFFAVWLAGGLYALLGANCLSELGAAIPLSGAQYAFSRRALGEYPGFIVGWSDWLSTCGTTAAVAFVIAEYVEGLVPAWRGATVATALSLTLAFALLQWRGFRWASVTQNLTSMAKALALLALVTACFLLGGGPRTEERVGMAAQGGPGNIFFALVIALQSVIYTYDGWSGPVYFSEEIRESDRSIPRALFGGVLAVMGIYLLLSLALLHVLPLSRIAGDRFAIGTAAGVVFGTRGDAIARCVMIISMLAGLNAYHLMASRVVFAMGRDGLFWKPASGVNPGGTPAVSLWLSAGVAALSIALSGTFRKMIDALSFFFVASYALSFLSLFVLRSREPALRRPFRAWGHPWTTALALCGSLVFLAGAVASDLRTGARSSLYAFFILLASYPAYRLIKLLRRTAGR
jgi:APA family basic amino acid/polyamine antiporter